MGVAAAATLGWVCLRRCAKSASVLTTPNPPLMLRRLFSTARQTSVGQTERVGGSLQALLDHSLCSQRIADHENHHRPRPCKRGAKIFVCGFVVSPGAFAVRGRCGGPAPPPPQGSASSPHCNRTHHTVSRRPLINGQLAEVRGKVGQNAHRMLLRFPK